MFNIVNVLLTRKCNLNCETCRLTKDYDGKPSNYSKIKNIKDSTVEKWKKFGKFIKDNNLDTFLLLYGGEPFLYKHLKDLILYYNEIDVPYSIITNASFKEKAMQLLPYLNEFTCSVDPLIFSKDDSDRFNKSKNGLELLIEMRKAKPEMILVAETVLDKENKIYLKRLLDEFKKYNIIASLSILEYDMSNYYNFYLPKDKVEKLALDKNDCDELYKEIIQLLKEGYNIHFPESVLQVLKNGTMNSNCSIENGFNTVTIDSDGSLMLCLRIEGTECKKVNIFDVIDKINNKEITLDQFIKDIESKAKTDKDKYCQKCSWTCTVMAENAVLDEITHLKDGE